MGTNREELKLQDLRNHLLDSHELKPQVADVIERMDHTTLSIFHSEVHLHEEIYLHD
jgi:hypothetical protein